MKLRMSPCKRGLLALVPYAAILVVVSTSGGAAPLHQSNSTSAPFDCQNCPSLTHCENHTKCVQCTTCPIGYGQEQQCLLFRDTTCKQCTEGVTFSSPLTKSLSGDQCRPCTPPERVHCDDGLFQTPCTVTEDTSCQSCRQGLSTGFGSQSATSSDLRLQCSWCTRCVGYVDQSASYCTSTLMQLCKASTTTAALLLTSAATSVPGRTSPAIAPATQNHSTTAVAGVHPFPDRSALIMSACLIAAFPIALAIITIVLCKKRKNDLMPPQGPQAAVDSNEDRSHQNCVSTCQDGGDPRDVYSDLRRNRENDLYLPFQVEQWETVDPLDRQSMQAGGRDHHTSAVSTNPEREESLTEVSFADEGLEMNIPVRVASMPGSSLTEAVRVSTRTWQISGITMESIEEPHTPTVASRSGGQSPIYSPVHSFGTAAQATPSPESMKRGRRYDQPFTTSPFVSEERNAGRSVRAFSSQALPLSETSRMRLRSREEANPSPSLPRMDDLAAAATAATGSQGKYVNLPPGKDEERVARHMREDDSEQTAKNYTFVNLHRTTNSRDPLDSRDTFALRCEQRRAMLVAAAEFGYSDGNESATSTSSRGNNSSRVRGTPTASDQSSQDINLSVVCDTAAAASAHIQAQLHLESPLSDNPSTLAAGNPTVESAASAQSQDSSDDDCGTDV